MSEQLVQIFADFAELRVEVTESHLSEQPNTHDNSDEIDRINLARFTQPIPRAFTHTTAA